MTITLHLAGDWYEALGTDAQTVATVCELVMIDRHLTAIPVYAHTRYVGQLLAAGYRVVLVDGPGMVQELTL